MSMYETPFHPAVNCFARDIFVGTLYVCLEIVLACEDLVLLAAIGKLTFVVVMCPMNGLDEVDISLMPF